MAPVSDQSGPRRNRVAAKKVGKPQGGLAFELDEEGPDGVLAAGDGEPVVEAGAGWSAARLDGRPEQPQPLAGEPAPGAGMGGKPMDQIRHLGRRPVEGDAGFRLVDL